MKFILIFLSMACLLLVACVSVKSKKANMHTPSMQLYTIDRIPTKPEQQEKTSFYIDNFKTVNEVFLSENEKKTIHSSLENITVLPTANIKRCPFVGQFAIVGTLKDNKPITLVFSTSPCNKIKIIQENGASSLIQLEDEDEFFAKISAIANKDI